MIDRHYKKIFGLLIGVGILGLLIATGTVAFGQASSIIPNNCFYQAGGIGFFCTDNAGNIDYLPVAPDGGQTIPPNLKSESLDEAYHTGNKIVEASPSPGAVLIDISLFPTPSPSPYVDGYVFKIYNSNAPLNNEGTNRTYGNFAINSFGELIGSYPDIHGTHGRNSIFIQGDDAQGNEDVILAPGLNRKRFPYNGPASQFILIGGMCEDGFTGCGTGGIDLIPGSGTKQSGGFSTGTVTMHWWYPDTDPGVHAYPLMRLGTPSNADSIQMIGGNELVDIETSGQSNANLLMYPDTGAVVFTYNQDGQTTCNVVGDCPGGDTCECPARGGSCVQKYCFAASQSEMLHLASSNSYMKGDPGSGSVFSVISRSDMTSSVRPVFSVANQSTTRLAVYGGPGSTENTLQVNGNFSGLGQIKINDTGEGSARGSGIVWTDSSGFSWLSGVSSTSTGTNNFFIEENGGSFAGVQIGYGTGALLPVNSGSAPDIGTHAAPWRNESLSGKMLDYNGEVTDGSGIPYITKKGQDVASNGAGAQSTTIATYSPAASGLFEAQILIDCSTADTVTATITYTDATNTTAITETPISSASCATNGVVRSNSLLIRANTSTAIVETLTLSSHNTTKAHGIIKRVN